LANEQFLSILSKINYTKGIQATANWFTFNSIQDQLFIFPRVPSTIYIFFQFYPRSTIPNVRIFLIY